MKPFGDADRDGLKNFKDCKPFDRMRKGPKHDEEKEPSFEDENTEEYFLGPDPRKHKDFEFYGGKKK